MSNVLNDMAEKRRRDLASQGKLIDPMVFDDDKKKSKLINPMIIDVPTKSFEDKVYIALIVLEGTDTFFDGQYKVCMGRTECYRYLEKLFETYGSDVNPYKSKIITETKQTETETMNTKYYLMPYGEIISVYAFCKSVEDYYGKTAFDIDLYASEVEEDEDEEEEIESSPALNNIDLIVNRQAALTGISAKQLNELRNTTTDNVSNLFGHLQDDDGVNI